MRNAVYLLTGLLALTTGCGSASSALDGSGAGTSVAGATGSAGASNGGSSGSAGAGASNGSAGASTAGEGLPCEVSAVLQKYCVVCHSNPPIAGAPQSMLSYANLQAIAKSVPTEKVGALSVTRMQDGTMPPRPFAAPTAAEQASFKAWVDSGMPQSSCGTTITPPPNPYDTPLMCSSIKTWTGGNRGSSSMHPGGACISCHEQGGDGPLYAIAGTVFPSAHEPDDCNGAASTTSGALSVLITDANGKSHSLPVNSVGNFYYEGAIATPYQAQVVSGTAIRVMAHTQVSGDCNGCHTVTGSSNTTGADPAPGRIMAP
jgi:hypothetical protein